MVNFFFVIIKVIGVVERKIVCQSVKIVGKQLHLGTTEASQCGQQTGNLSQICKKFLSTRTVARWKRHYAPNV